MLQEILTVSALNRRARETLQQNFPLLWVAGEISNLVHHASGHVYFSLKDESAQVRCTLFRNRAQLLPWRLENGQQVEARVQVSLYEPRGDFQLNVDSLRRAGLGKLYEAFAWLRDQLEREGLFAVERKRPLPRFPRRIGIVSSPQAAALHDILVTLRRRAPNLPVILYPAPVQGEGAGARIAAALAQAGARAAQDGVDVLIIARGGGSIEDLWAFNEECVARAIAACPLPVVSGVGHENDVTIADHAADRRAATPTAAAELVSTGWFAAAQELQTLATRLHHGLRTHIETRMQRIDLLAHRLTHPGRRLEHDRQTLAHLSTRLPAALMQRLQHNAAILARWRLRLHQARPDTQATAGRLALLGQRLGALAARNLAHDRSHLATLAAGLAQLSPQATLERGYSIVRDSRGTVVSDSRQLAAGERIDLHFASGRAHARIDGIEQCATERMERDEAR